MNDSNFLPCNGCDDRSSCRGSCPRLHKFLREDEKCHTRTRMTEYVIPAESVARRSDYLQAKTEKSIWQEYSKFSPGYWDIMNSVYVPENAKEIFFLFYTMGMTYKQIAMNYRLTERTIKRILDEGRDRVKRNYKKETGNAKP